MSQKDKTLDELVEDKWLCRTGEGNIGLGIRSLLDLRSWFRNNDVPSCEVCNEAGVKADLCPSEGCTVRIHKYCLKNLLSQRDDKVCSGCGKPWPLSRITKEEAVEAAGNDEEEEDETQATTPRSKRRKVRSQRDSAENGSSQAYEASTSGTTGRRVTRSVANLRCEPLDTYPRTYDLLHAKVIFKPGPLAILECMIRFCFGGGLVQVQHDNDDARDGPDSETWRTCIHKGYNQCDE